MARFRYTLTPPGTPIARRYGCTCPRPQPQRPAKFDRAEDCPLHTRPHSFDSDDSFAQARGIEDARQRQRNRV